MSGEKKAPTAPKTLSESIHDAAIQIRSVSKWIVAAFGALGAALIGGASIVDLRTLSDSGQNWASFGLVLAILGVVLVIAPAALVLAPRMLSFDQLRPGTGEEADVAETLETKFAGLLGGYASLAEIHEERERLGSELTDAKAAIGILRANPDASDEATIAMNDRTTAVRQQVDRLNEVSANILSIANFVRLRAQFTRALQIGLLGVGFATAGAICFVTAETADQRSAEAASLSPLVTAGPEPVAVALDFAQDQTDRYAAILGEDCDLDAVAALVLGRDDDSRRVVVLPQDECEPKELDVPDEAATATSVDVACRFDTNESGVGC